MRHDPKLDKLCRSYLNIWCWNGKTKCTLKIIRQKICNFWSLWHLTDLISLKHATDDAKQHTPPAHIILTTGTLDLHSDPVWNVVRSMMKEINTFDMCFNQFRFTLMFQNILFNLIIWRMDAADNLIKNHIVTGL